MAVRRYQSSSDFRRIDDLTLYYDHAGISIHLGDCREVLPTLTESFDLLLADPPYGDTSLDWDVRDVRDRWDDHIPEHRNG